MDAVRRGLRCCRCSQPRLSLNASCSGADDPSDQAVSDLLASGCGHVKLCEADVIQSRGLGTSTDRSVVHFMVHEIPIELSRRGRPEAETEEAKAITNLSQGLLEEEEEEEELPLSDGQVLPACPDTAQR